MNSDESPCIYVNQYNEIYDIIHENEKVCVKYTASWCNPCKRIQPLTEEFAKKYKNEIVFVIVDIDEYNNEVVESPQLDLKKKNFFKPIVSLPTFRAYSNAKVIDDFIGASEIKFISMMTSLTLAEKNE